MASHLNQDRRLFTQQLFAAMAHVTGHEQIELLRQITTRVLAFSPVSDSIIALGHQHLPQSAAVLGTLDSEFGPGYTAVHFDLSSPAAASSPRPYVTNARIQAANRAVQQYVQVETYPLLIFTLPDNSGVQFVTGEPSPINPNQLTAVVRVTAYWASQNRTALDCLERTGNAIANGQVPENAFRVGFDVQPVTDEFFKSYRDAYDQAVTALAESIPTTSAEQFVQILFNRLMFIHFVSKKGWMTLDGNTDYLNALWRSYRSNQQESNFYQDRLDTLFFHGLNNPESHLLRDTEPEHHTAIGDVPFLNGGLFEKTSLDAQATDGTFTVPDEVIEPVITDLFNRHNFTVMEATPLDTEVAVDPEMLGKLFEETVNERNSSGAYYTPRPVVAFMCREAIKEYLAAQDIAGLTTESLTDLLDNQNPRAVTQPQALQIATAVNQLKAVDPACGSGAFLLGLLQEVVALNDTLFRAGQTAKSLFEQKLAIITNNIYGADKDALAVSTAMLRLWLSLAVDYDDDEAPDPLPNLDLKLVVGDTIAGPNPSMDDLYSHQIAQSSLRQNIADYTTAQGPDKTTLRTLVEQAKQELSNSIAGTIPPGVVDWRIDFADVMLDDGFDIVIGNPPYVQLQRNSGELANLYRNVGYKTFDGTGDIYQLFYERGCQLLKPTSGLLAYITSNSWMRAKYGASTRKYLATTHTPTLLIEMGKDVFDDAIVDTSVLLLREAHRDTSDYSPVPAVDIEHLDQGKFPPDPESWGYIRPSGETPWSILSATGQSVMDKMLSTGVPLRDWGPKIHYGIKTGYNKAFVINYQTRAQLVHKDPRAADIIKPILRGQDIRKYHSPPSHMFLIDTHNGYGVVPRIETSEYPSISEHLNQFLDQLRNRQDQGATPHNLRSCAYHEEFSKEKLLWIDLTNEGRFTYDDGDNFCVNTVFFLTGGSLKYLCAVLNSRLTTWFMNNTALNSGMGVTRWIGHTVGQIPVPQIPPDRQAPFIQLVDQILGAKTGDPDADTSEIEAEIDRQVYSLYGLTEAETAAIANA